MLVDWATFDFNAAIFFQGNNPIISSYETQYESRYETQYEGMQMEIDILSFSDANVVCVITPPFFCDVFNIYFSMSITLKLAWFVPLICVVIMQDSYYIIPNHEATDDMLVSLWD